MSADLRQLPCDEFPEVSARRHAHSAVATTTAPIRGRPSHIEAAVGLTSPNRDLAEAGETKAGPDQAHDGAGCEANACPASRSRSASRSSKACSTRCSTPHSQLFAIKVFGDDFDELRRIGNDIIAVLNTIVPGGDPRT